MYASKMADDEAMVVFVSASYLLLDSYDNDSLLQRRQTVRRVANLVKQKIARLWSKNREKIFVSSNRDV
jgi:hypothetical protein